MELKAGFICDRGLNPKRPVNQDRYLVMPERGLFAVFDGVGGQRAGEVASETAAETIEESLAHITAASSGDLIRRAIQFANRDIFEMAESDPAYKTMATTVALLYIDGDRATIAHVGDSRVYRLEEGRFSRETIDHTDYHDDLRAGLSGGAPSGRRNVINRALGVEAEVDVETKTIHVHDGVRFLLCSDGIYRHLSDEEMARVLAQFKDPQQAAGSNVINRALGVEAEVDVETKTIQVRDGVRFLLCSDGIYRHLSDEEMARVLAQFKDPQAAADELKRIVHERGADDNLTAVIVQVGRARQSAVLAIADGIGDRSSE